ncbi:MAG: Gfo/Idh/MocA family oxidoreductase [Myxococcota bacterium]|nr:Gfo/Idh/MocA family oxidoreductase [Myxococcota bacterium]
MDKKLRIGTLGAAKITPLALLNPARHNRDVEVVAVAARSSKRAERFARRHRIPSVLESYEALIQSPDIDAIYNPLPNSHHAYWSIRAMEEGKHVLCEKPMAANAKEAREMQRVSQKTNRVLMEAFHWRYHPLALRLIELIENKSIGSVHRIEASFCIPLPFPNDIRYNEALAGGSLMDTGCYTVSILRHLMKEEPAVVEAVATKHSANLDRYMQAQLSFPSGAVGSLRCSLWGWPPVSAYVNVYGETGSLRAFNPIGPHILYHHLKIKTPSGSRTERFWGSSTYSHQLQAFVDAVQHGAPIPTDGEDAIQNMKLIDSIYQKAGMQPREGFWP